MFPNLLRLKKISVNFEEPIPNSNIWGTTWKNYPIPQTQSAVRGTGLGQRQLIGKGVHQNIHLQLPSLVPQVFGERTSVKCLVQCRLMEREVGSLPLCLGHFALHTLYSSPSACLAVYVQTQLFWPEHTSFHLSPVLPYSPPDPLLFTVKTFAQVAHSLLSCK